jgi:hypothetical protein
MSQVKYKIPQNKLTKQNEICLSSILFEKNLAMSPIFFDSKETTDTLFDCNYSILLNPQEHKMNIFSTITDNDGFSQMLINY